jgi:hypothetical protein
MLVGGTDSDMNATKHIKKVHLKKNSVIVKPYRDIHEIFYFNLRSSSGTTI